MRLLWSIVKKTRRFVGMSILIGIGSIAITIVWNDWLAKLINLVSRGQRIGIEKVICAFLLILATALIQALLTLVSGYTCERMNHELRMWYANRYRGMDLLQLEAMNTGQELSMLHNELAEVSAYISSNLFQLVNDLLKFVGTFAWIILLNYRLALSANLPVIFIVIYVAISSKVISKLSAIAQQENQHMNGLVDTILTLFPVMKVYDAGKLIYDNYYRVVAAWEKASKKEECIRACLMSLSAVLSCLPLLLLLLIGGRQVILADMEIGTLYIFINLSGNVSGVMINMPGYIGAFRRFITNMERLQSKQN
jgi:ABC-type multidrug transport system fused ATPase/permease subunit